MRQAPRPCLFGRRGRLAPPCLLSPRLLLLLAPLLLLLLLAARAASDGGGVDGPAAGQAGDAVVGNAELCVEDEEVEGGAGFGAAGGASAGDGAGRKRCAAKYRPSDAEGPSALYRRAPPAAGVGAAASRRARALLAEGARRELQGYRSDRPDFLNRRANKLIIPMIEKAAVASGEGVALRCLIACPPPRALPPRLHSF